MRLKPGTAGTSLVLLPSAALYSWTSSACSRIQPKVLAYLTAQQRVRKMPQSALDLEDHAVLAVSRMTGLRRITHIPPGLL